MVLVSISFTNF